MQAPYFNTELFSTGQAMIHSMYMCKLHVVELHQLNGQVFSRSGRKGCSCQAARRVTLHVCAAGGLITVVCCVYVYVHVHAVPMQVPREPQRVLPQARVHWRVT